MPVARPRLIALLAGQASALESGEQSLPVTSAPQAVNRCHWGSNTHKVSALLVATHMVAVKSAALETHQFLRRPSTWPVNTSCCPSPVRKDLRTVRPSTWAAVSTCSQRSQDALVRFIRSVSRALVPLSLVSRHYPWPGFCRLLKLCQ